MRCHVRFIALLIVSMAFVTANASAQRAPSQPEAASGFDLKPLALARRQMVAAANPLAVEAGLEILNAGGSAIDAAIAVQLVLNLVEPQSSGIGGGAFLLTWDAQTRRLRSFDGRETAPAAAQPNRFLKSDGSQRAFDEAVFGGQSVGVPGLIRVLQQVHASGGARLPWARLFQPAITLAEDGFKVSPRLNALIAEQGPGNFAPAARQYFFDDKDQPREVDALLKNPAFATTLRTIADQGADAFYTGPIADGIVATVRTAPNHQGDLTLEDLAAYRAKERPPVCITYRGHRVCGMGPPSSGGPTVAQVLKLIEPTNLGAIPLNPAAMHTIVEAEKLAFADRDQFIADPDVVSIPRLLDPTYLASRRALIGPVNASAKAEPGQPPGTIGARTGLDATTESIGTSHISIIDRFGNAVAMTTTIENGFGARLMTGGFLLNNQLTDFSARPVDASGAPVANAVAPGKRPRSSMSPTIIFAPDGRVKAVLGSPGGSRIILYVVKAIVGVIDWKLDAQAAIDLANFGSRNGPVEIEQAVAGVMPTLHMRRYGHEVRLTDMTSGTHMIIRRGPGRLEGGADPRREGIAKGD
jgi:gamma-glutamyltranspeptidase / glutathione hydrolase